MARVCSYINRLHGVTIGKLMPLFAMVSMDESWFGGILQRYSAGEPAVVSADLTKLEELMEDETIRRRAINLDGADVQARANRARGNTRGPAPSPAPFPGPAPAPSPSPAPAPTFPPTRGPQWSKVQAAFTESPRAMCGNCYCRDPFHWEVGCPALAQIGLVTVRDDNKCKVILDKVPSS